MSLEHKITCDKCGEDRIIKSRSRLWRIRKGERNWCKKCSSKESGFSVGHKPWNAGKRVQNNTGRTQFKKGMTPWNWGVRGYKAGSNHYNWKGGITPENHLIRNSSDYKNWRKSVFERDNFTCTECGIHGCYLHADHIEPFSENKEKRLDINNGRTLCRGCHYQHTFGKDKRLVGGWSFYTDAGKGTISTVERT